MKIFNSDLFCKYCRNPIKQTADNQYQNYHQDCYQEVTEYNKYLDLDFDLKKKIHLSKVEEIRREILQELDSIRGITSNTNFRLSINTREI